MSTEQSALHDLVLQSIQRDVNRLNDAGSDRVSKRRALESIEKIIFGSSKDNAVYIELFETLSETLLKMSVDSVEKCRELSIKMIANFIKFEKEAPTSHVSKVLKVVRERLTKGNPEEVEEIRLEWIEVCGEIIKQRRIGGDELSILVEVFQASLQDVFPELKKRSIQLVIELGRNVGESLRLHVQPLVKALIPSLTHRHSSVRISSLQALEVLVELDMLSLSLVLEHLHKLIFDKSASVRQALYTVVKQWIHQRIRDKTSFKILPIILAGMSDEVKDLQSLCTQYLLELGTLYADSAPNALVEDSVEYTLPMVLEDTQHWSSTNRVLALKVLDTLIECAGKRIEAHTATILQSLYTQVQHKDPVVVAQGVKCAVTLGKFVDPSIYAHLTIQQINSASQESRPNLLMILEACIRGSSCSQLLQVTPWLVETLCHKKFIHEEECLQSSVDIVYSLITKMSEGGITLTKCTEGYQLLYLLLILQDDQENIVKITSATSVLATMHGLSNPGKLYSEYLGDLLDKLKSNESKWVANSLQFRVFCRLLIESSDFIEAHLEQILRTFKNLADIKREEELRIKAFRTLAHVFQHSTVRDQYAMPLIFEVILPNLEYRPPQKTPLVRAAAIESLHALIEVGSSNVQPSTEQCSQLVMLLCQCLEDEFPETRFKSLKLLEATVKKFSFQLASGHLVLAMYPEILKRLDDAQDEVRNEAVAGISQLLESIPVDLEEKHIETILKTLMLQLNDGNTEYQYKIITALKHASNKFPTLVHSVANTVRPILIDPQTLDQIQQER